MGLSFVDFWLTATSSGDGGEDNLDLNELNHEICQLAQENVWLTDASPLFAQMERILSEGAALYLQKYFGAEESIVDTLLLAANFGRKKGDCNHIVFSRD